ncbi:MAG: alpha/beta hydrolase [Ilumatobacteraceae bacterium]|nr:alpha/beta hydrolase [Ilumatobacteraceae bacterium]
MSVVAAVLLLFVGLVGLLSSWNAARPLIDPTRRYSPSWLPAMVVTELAPFWVLVHLGVLVGGLALGGWENWGGRIGVGLLAASMILLGWIMMRTLLAVRRLRRLVDGPVHRPSGVARLVGRPVRTPLGVREIAGLEWRHGLTLDLIRPDDDRRELPVVVYVHGGGWTGGGPQRQGRDMYHTLALDGWATLAIRYPFTPQVTVLDQIAAVRDAVTWARTHGPDHGVVPTMVVLAGGSAGAHLATMAALTPADDTQRVAGIVGLYGIYDMANRHGQRAHWDMIRRDVMRASVAEAPQRYDAVSPLVQRLSAAPPMLIVHGTRDTLVPIGEAEQFVEALRSAGRPVDFVPVVGAQHAFDAVTAPVPRATAAAIRTWLRGLEGAA